MRRSPAVYCYTPLPLDLHVLSLPLAFILSQDQTLHCKNCLYFLTFDSSVSLRPASPDFRHTLSLHLRNSMFSRFPEPPSQGCRSPSKAGAKIRPFFKLPNFFSNYFSGLPTNGLSDSGLHRKKIFVGTRKRPQKSRKKEKDTAFFTVFGVCLPDKKRHVFVFCCFSVIYGIFIVRVFCRIAFHQFVAQYFTKTVIRDISPYFFLRCLPHSYLFHALPCPAALSQSTGPRPVHCSMRRQRIRTASIYYL